jgi:hypothetical protein
MRFLVGHGFPAPEGSLPGWGLGATVTALSVAFVFLVFVLMYGMSNQSSPTTAGQGGSPPAPVMR